MLRNWLENIGVNFPARLVRRVLYAVLYRGESLIRVRLNQASRFLMMAASSDHWAAGAERCRIKLLRTRVAQHGRSPQLMLSTHDHFFGRSSF